MCDPVSATIIGTMAFASMAMMPPGGETNMPPPYVPPPPPPAPNLPQSVQQPFQQSPGALSLGAKSPYETKLKARQRRQKHLPVSAMAGLNIPSASPPGEGGTT